MKHSVPELNSRVSFKQYQDDDIAAMALGGLMGYIILGNLVPLQILQFPLAGLGAVLALRGYTFYKENYPPFFVSHVTQWYFTPDHLDIKPDVDITPIRVNQD